MLVERRITLQQIDLLHYIKVGILFLMLFHVFIQKVNYSSFTTTILNTLHHFQTNPHHQCNKAYLEESNKTPIKCNSNYCSNLSLFFTTSFSSFEFEKFMGKETDTRFFLYDDPSYYSFFNSIWIPPEM